MLNARCIQCDFEGVLEVLGAQYELPASRLFRYLGHDPSSGHVHYQCPACNIVLLVDPLDILGDSFIIEVRENPMTAGVLQTSYSSAAAN